MKTLNIEKVLALLFYVATFAFGSVTAMNVVTQLGGDITQLGDQLILSGNGKVAAVAGGTLSALRVYFFNGIDWVQLGDDIPSVGQQFAGEFPRDCSLSLSRNGRVLAVGEPSASFDRGSARVFSYNSSGWFQTGDDIPLVPTGAYFNVHNLGQSISLSSDGQTVAVSQSIYDITASQAVVVHIYSYNGTDWIQKGTNIDGGYVAFSPLEICVGTISLSSDGDMIALGSCSIENLQAGNPNDGRDQGGVRIFRFNGSDWIQVGSQIGDAFTVLGLSLSNNGKSTVAVRTPEKVLVYSYNESSSDWTQQGNAIQKSNPGVSIWGTELVSLSENGENWATVDDDGVYIYKKAQDGEWVKYGEILGKADSCSLNDDATLVAVGKKNAGTRVYEIPSTYIEDIQVQQDSIEVRGLIN